MAPGRNYAVLVGMLLGGGLYLLVFRPLEYSARRVREIEALLSPRGAAPRPPAMASRRCVSSRF